MFPASCVLSNVVPDLLLDKMLFSLLPLHEENEQSGNHAPFFDPTGTARTTNLWGDVAPWPNG
jgi:hypothetical protein